MIHTILFDLDGTLLNTLDDLADAGNWVCEQNGWATHPVEAYKRMVGNGIPKLVERFSPAEARTPERLAVTLAQFSARYDAHKQDKTAPYAGIPQLLDDLRAEGIQSAVFSNKADALCGSILAHYFGEGCFAAVRGSRPNVPTKPNPAGLFDLMQQLGAEPQDCLFIGDSDVDILTGHNAHLPAVGVLWGFRGKEELVAAGADYLAAEPQDILNLVRKLNHSEN
jgi:phosphoglycolate phosphatase